MRIQLRNNNPAAPGGKGEDFFAPYMDTFLLDGAKEPLGAVVILPGGGYTHRAYHEGDPVARKFNELGYHAFVVQYRVEPYAYPAAQQDALRAIKIVRQHAEEWGVNPDQIAIGGFSAGGHLAACAALMYDKINADEGDEADGFSAAPNAQILCYGVLSVTETYTKRGFEVYKGSPYRDEKDADIEPYKLVKSGSVPAYVWHTAEDTCVPPLCSVLFAQAMWEKGNSCELHLFATGNHGRGLWLGAKDNAGWPEEAALFLEKRAKFDRA